MGAVPRLCASLLDKGLSSALAGVWLELPAELEGKTLTDVFTGERLTPGKSPRGNSALEIGPRLAQFPALLFTHENDG